jgi:hypothetical protein
MRGRLAAATTALALVTLAGCGESGHGSSSTGGTGSEGSAPAALTGHVLAAGDLAGFAPSGRTLAGTTAASWVGGIGLPPAERANEISRLQRVGFRAGIRELLAATGGGGAEAISLAEQFSSPAQAHAEVAKQLQELESHGERTFAVARVPGARGVAISARARSGVNIEFADGSYFYVVGAGWPTGTSAAPSRATLETAAQRLYRRVHG